MDGGWQDHLHFSLLGEHVLFPGLHLDSWWRFIEACVLTVVICVCERYAGYLLILVSSLTGMWLGLSRMRCRGSGRPWRGRGGRGCVRHFGERGCIGW